MTIPEINQLRREGKIEDAYMECKQLHSQNPNDRFVRITMAWCLKSLAEEAAKTQNTARFVDILRELADLRLAEIGELTMANRFVWDLKTLFGSLSNNPDAIVSTADQVLNLLPELSFARPQRYYSMLADIFVKVKGRQNRPWLKFIDFMDWFGFDNLMPEDYNRIPLREPGRSMPSVAERIHSAYYKALMAQIESGYIDESKVEQFLRRLTTLNERHPEYQYTLYQKAQLLLALNCKQEALIAIRPFVKRKLNDFWVWDVLCDTSDDQEMKLSCCCRALLCRTEPKFLGKVHLKTAKLMHALGYDGNARTEIREMHRIYDQNGWQMPAEAIEMVRSQWYQKAIASESNKVFYSEHLSKSEELLFIDIPEIPILITNYNHEKKICTFVTVHKKRGFFSTRRLNGRFAENQIYLVRFDQAVEEGERSVVLTCKSVDDVSPFVGIFFKKIDGLLKYREGNAFGFVDDVFVSNQYFPQCVSNNTPVKGTAVVTYNKRKESWGWKAISLKVQ